MISNTILLISSVTLTTNLIAQNLVPNPDFELRDADFCGISSSMDLGNTISDWYSPTGGSPDIYFTDIDSTCWNYQPNSSYLGPIGFKGTQLPRSGSAMVGMAAYTIPSMNQREYLQVQLNSATVPSGKYVVEAYVSLGDFVEFSSNGIGFHLSTSPVSIGTDGVLPVTPQYEVSSLIPEIQEWVRIFDTITVTDAYTYLTIGNFNDDGATTTGANPTASGEAGTYGSYYFVDDVRIERVFTGGTSHLEELSGLNVRIFPNPTSDVVGIDLQKVEGVEKIELLDANGKVIWSESNVSDGIEIDLRQFEDGVYFVRVNTSLNSFVEKIVKR